MSKRQQFTTIETAMRVILAVQEVQKRNPHFLMADVADLLRKRYGMHKSTAFRYVRTAVDVLCIHYDEADPHRIARNGERKSGRFTSARSQGWPNGKPGVKSISGAEQRAAA